MRRFLFPLALALLATPVWAQQVKIAFHDGQVNVETVSASPRVILAEWSRVGGTNIVNGERVSGSPLTLALVNVPEAQALEIILRSVAGYMAAPRRQTSGGSQYDRILVLPTATVKVASVPEGPAPGRTGPGLPPGGPMMGNQRSIPRPSAAPSPVEEAAVEIEEPTDVPQNEPVFAFPQPNQPGYGGSTPVPPMAHPETAGYPNTAAPTVFGAPAFGAPMPGMIQVPPQPKPAAPGRPPQRPPGQ